MKERPNIPYLKLFTEDSFDKLVHEIKTWLLSDCAEQKRRSIKALALSADCTATALPSFSCLVHYEIGNPQVRELVGTAGIVGTQGKENENIENLLNSIATGKAQKVVADQATYIGGSGIKRVAVIVYIESLK